jgi:ubiquinone/menaquinone biosynthesis C-methylase UbiE
MPLGTLIDITHPYSPLTAWGYDALIARAVQRLVSGVLVELEERLPRGASVLDVGCGGGQILAALARRRPDLRLHGLDLSQDQVDRATRRVGGVNRSASIVCGSALELPQATGEIDHVISVASLKHWPNRPLGLQECLRVLRPKGELTLIEVDRGCTNRDAMRFIGDWPVPWMTRPLALAVFRTWVAGPSIDLDDARTLIAGLSDDFLSAARLLNTPMLVIRRRL